MRETSTDFIKGENFMTYFSTDPTEIKYMKSLIEKYPQETNVNFEHCVDDVTSYEITIPITWFRRPKPPAKKNLTNEQRQAIGQRMKNIHHKNEKETQQT